MIKNGPALLRLYDLRKVFRWIVHGNVKHLILNITIRIQILSRIVRIIHRDTADLLLSCLRFFRHSFLHPAILMLFFIPIFMPRSAKNADAVTVSCDTPSVITHF